ncbi:MAG: serine hydrolase [Proteobacteria bacterium]|nr:serine hydrolase [Pseudomonadota bacterium]MBU1386301.1 serine hydrolase [Pseudomonadota bacterium]MBU1543951.1 serine hydrolase [Pseudomonadota bacterium]MBU2482252.1 serine hydrolase [Pseudomonadota bacterium]
MSEALLLEMMEKAVSRGVFPGAVLLCSKGDDIVFNASFGMANIFENEQMQTTHIFDLASLTKPFATTLAISKLIEQKKTGLHRELGSILKPFSQTSKAKITVDMLLRHTSGLPAYREYYKKMDTEKKISREYLRQLLVDQNLENPINSCQVYSDPGFMILSWIIEEVSGQRLDDFVRENIFIPLGIDHLFFVDLHSATPGSDFSEKKFAATQICPWRGKLLVGEVDDENAWAAGGIEGHAGLFGDAFSVFVLCCELLKILQGRRSKVLNPFVLQKLLKKDPKNQYDMVAGFDTPSKQNSSAGQFFSRGSIGHLGFTGTSFWIDPETALSVILLTNRVHPLRSNEGIKQFRPVLHDLIYSIYA